MSNTESGRDFYQRFKEVYPLKVRSWQSDNGSEDFTPKSLLSNEWPKKVSDITIPPSVQEALQKLQDAGLWLSETFVKDVCRKAEQE